MKELTVSIVVPSFNQGHLIRYTLDSILSQGVERLDVRVVDGGSKDQTLEELRAYGEGIAWTSEPDRGQTHAINKGMACAVGDVVAYINSDDTYEPGTLRRVLDLFEQHPDVDFIYGDANFVDEQGQLIRVARAVDFDLDILTYDYNYICQPATFWRRSAMERVGLFDEGLYYYMDYEFFLRLARSGARFMHVRQPLSNLRLHAVCKTVTGANQRPGQMQRERAEVLNRYRRNFGPAWLNAGVYWLLKYANRCRKFGKDIFENGELPSFGFRALMQRVQQAGQ